MHVNVNMGVVHFFHKLYNVNILKLLNYKNKCEYAKLITIIKKVLLFACIFKALVICKVINNLYNFLIKYTFIQRRTF